MNVNGKDDMKLPLLEPFGAVVLDIKSVRNVDQGVRTLTFKIGGIECASCSTSELHELNGVEIAIVSPLQGQFVVKYIPISDHIYNCFKPVLGDVSSTPT
ncbi:putative heavy metal-associated domain superfamily [Helianthus annuus]|nr:putative heavy metal-associated domain superfamily [Helianthus annuus]